MKMLPVVLAFAASVGSLRAAAMEIAWDIPVSPAFALDGTITIGLPVNFTSDGGGGVMVTFSAERFGENGVVFTWLDSNGSIKWRSPHYTQDVLLIKLTPSEVIYVSPPEASGDPQTQYNLVFNEQGNPVLSQASILGLAQFGQPPPQKYSDLGPNCMFVTAADDLLNLSIRKYNFPVAPSLQLAASQSSGVSLNNLSITWKSELGRKYQVQQCTDLAGPWTNVGVQLDGNGASQSYSTPITQTSQYLRVIYE